MRVFPIEPNSDKHITLKYTQLLNADNGLITYAYPLNTEKFSAKPIDTVSLHCEIKTDHPLKTIYSPTHEVEVTRHGNQARSWDLKAETPARTPTFNSSTPPRPRRNMASPCTC